MLKRIVNLHGGKYSAAPWILRFAPPHRCFVDLFGGSAALFCHREPVGIEVYNDLGSEVVHFFRQLREAPAALAHAVRFTPWSREEFQRAWEPTDEPTERARRFFVRAWQSRGTAALTSQGRWRAGWRLQREDRSRTGLLTEQWAALPSALLAFAERFKRVQVEQDDALTVLRRYDAPTTLHYADPPYLPAVRSRWAGHAYEVETSEEKHIALAEALHRCQGFALVSGYPSPLYAELYERRGWRREERRAFNVAGRPSTEALWLCPRTQAALSRSAGPLFASAQGVPR